MLHKLGHEIKFPLKEFRTNNLSVYYDEFAVRLVIYYARFALNDETYLDDSNMDQFLDFLIIEDLSSQS